MLQKIFEKLQVPEKEPSDLEQLEVKNLIHDLVVERKQKSQQVTRYATLFHTKSDEFEEIQATQPEVINEEIEQQIKSEQHSKSRASTEKTKAVEGPKPPEKPTLGESRITQITKQIEGISSLLLNLNSIVHTPTTKKPFKEINIQDIPEETAEDTSAKSQREENGKLKLRHARTMKTNSSTRRTRKDKSES